MFEAALDGSFKGMYIQGEDMAQSDPNTQHVTAAFSAMECVVVQDLFLNETAKYAHVFLPGAPSWRRMAPSPTRNDASRAFAK